MATITSINLANAMTKLVAAEALPMLTENLVMGNLVQRNFEPGLCFGGETIHVPTEAGTIAEVKVDTHAEASFQVPDITKVLAAPDLLKLYMTPAIQALAENVEKRLWALSQQLLHKRFFDKELLTSGSITNEIETILFDSRVMASEQKVLAVGARAYNALRQNPRFNEYNTASEAGLRKPVAGAVGKINDLYVVRSADAATCHGVELGAAFCSRAMGLVIRRIPQPLPGTGAISEYAEFGNFGIRVVMSYKPDSLTQMFTVDLIYGTGILRPEFGVALTAAVDSL